ncbi:thymidylate synthase [Lacinutrix sp. WUR7]|uniref:thymidylate synthase n=1 Tax=Lacinutrix sp. WUR7 TaxID=2653681 RepID=UPI00193CB865|nr:thymidylate synthase [Lacinutrix sp. WUR7]QRM89052.1 thymidylate synthase [Lacinutrix sp. WUR7]
MHIIEKTLDDILNRVFTELLKLPFDVIPTKGASSEIFGCLIELKNPRARLSITETKGKAFSSLGELFWYLSKTNALKYIKYYIPQYVKSSDDNETIYGGYGPRLFKKDGHINQVNNVIEILRKKPNSRRAVIQLFDAKDLIEQHKDIPCTTTLQFTVRNGKLIMMTSMRSNDAFLGLPHDIFCFTMLQEIIAVSLGIEIGSYHHAIGSLHLYKKNKLNAEKYLSEGTQSTNYQMPKMPIANPWDSLQKIISAERLIRKEKFDQTNTNELDPYWQDLTSLLKIHTLLKKKKYIKIEEVKKEINNTLYHSFIDQRVKTNQKIKRH